ncbi:uncharacterized protein VTP21DRAFT_10200 [Calcarisporiella thermophila]|uniref:uncharacterized protein n=1 Tax=Calcarisporiella thermophila TaxID=911321 RepID=UPI00374249FC
MPEPKPSSPLGHSQAYKPFSILCIRPESLCLPARGVLERGVALDQGSMVSKREGRLSGTLAQCVVGLINSKSLILKSRMWHSAEADPGSQGSKSTTEILNYDWNVERAGEATIGEGERVDAGFRSSDYDLCEGPGGRLVVQQAPSRLNFPCLSSQLKSVVSFIMSCRPIIAPQR